MSPQSVATIGKEPRIMTGKLGQTARKFREYWTFRRGSEKGEDKQFWNSLLRDVFGKEDNQ